MRHRDLFEKRSNPELNPRVSPLEHLKRHEGKGLYISFTEGFGKVKSPKLGVNPRSPHRTTPLGVYAYPVDYIVDLSEDNPSNVDSTYGNFYTGGIEAPYMGENKWENAWIFAVDPGANILTDDSITKDQYQAKLAEVEQIAGAENFTSTQQVLDNNSQLPLHLKLYTAVKLTCSESERMPVAITSMLRRLGYQGVEDYGEGVIHENEPTQIVLFDPKIIRPVDIIHRSSGDERVQDRWLLEVNATGKEDDPAPILLNMVERLPVVRAARFSKYTILETVRTIVRWTPVEASTHMVPLFLSKCPTNKIGAAVSFAALSIPAILDYAVTLPAAVRAEVMMKLDVDMAHYLLVQSRAKLDTLTANGIAGLVFRNAYRNNLQSEVAASLDHPERFEDYRAFVSQFVGKEALADELTHKADAIWARL